MAGTKGGGKYHPFNVSHIDIGIQHSEQGTKGCTLPEAMIRYRANAMNGSLFALLDKKGVKATTLTDTKSYYYIEKPHYPAFCIDEDIPAAGCGSVMKVQVDQTNGIIPNMIGRNECTGEQVMIQSVPESNCVYIERGMGVLGGLPMKKGDKITIIGSAFEESSMRPLPTSSNYDRVDFTTQISRATWGVSQTEACVARTGLPPTKMRNKMGGAFAHKRDIELTLWFGEYYHGTKNGQPIRKIDGFDALVSKYAPQNVFMAPATVNFEQFETMLDSTKLSPVAEDVGGSEPLIIGGIKSLKVINQIIKNSGTVQFEQGQTEFGFNFQTIITTAGRYHFMHNPLMDTNPSWCNMIRIVNLSSMDVKYLCDRRHKHNPYNENTSNGAAATDNGIDATGGAFLSEFSLHMYSPASNALIYGFCEAGCPAPCEYTEWCPQEMCTDECGRLVPNLHEDDRLIYACENDKCPCDGVPFVPRPKPVKLDKCGNPVCAPKVSETGVAVQICCDYVQSLETSCGTLMFEGTNWKDPAELAAAQAALDAFLADNGGGTGLISYAPGVITITVEGSKCEFTAIAPLEAESTP